MKKTVSTDSDFTLSISDFLAAPPVGLLLYRKLEKRVLLAIQEIYRFIIHNQHRGISL
jgi:hypothetical protein